MGHPLRGNPAIPAAFAERVVPGGNGVVRPTVVADGVAVATWFRPRRGRAVVVDSFEAADPGFAAAVAAAAVCLP